MPRTVTCCVPECKYKPGTVRHNFPVYEKELFKIWVERIANPRFAKLDYLFIYKNFLVCDNHFNVHCKSVGTKRLKKFSLPTQNLPAFDGEWSLQTSMHNHLKEAKSHSGCTVGEGLSDPAAEDTADFLLFMDRLFDSVNGSCPVPLAGKNLRCTATTTSPHNEFWAKALKMLSSMTFRCCKTQRKSVPPSLEHCIWTISGLRHLSDRLLNGGFRFLALRNFNQDPLENFFCGVRSHGVRNVNPTSTGFVSAFKSLIVSNFMSSHSLSSNCEEDDTEGALDTLKSFLQADEIPVEQPQEVARLLCHHGKKLFQSRELPQQHPPT